MEPFLHWISHYGYPAIFSLLVLGIVGLPIPDETMLTFAGYLAYKGKLGYLATIAVAFLGTSCGITSSYIIGRSLGFHLLKKYGRYVHITEERLLRVHNWFERVGKWTLTLGYFVPGVRHLTALVAGSSKLEVPRFCLFAYTGGFLWSFTFVSLGYFLGEGWHQIAAEIHLLLIGIGILATCALLFCLVWYRGRLRKG